MEKEIRKLEKRIREAKQSNNHKELIELHNIVGGLYSDIGSYYEAIHHHKEALEAAKTLGDQQATAVALRYVGEATASTGSFYQAIDYIKKYLDLAKKLEDKVEIQRAWTTMGRVYLMKAQDMKENSDIIDDSIKSTANEALKKFQTALDLAESVQSQIDDKEFAQMKSGLFVNIGLLEDILGHYEQCRGRFFKAIEICKTARIKEDLYRCQVLLASLSRQRDSIKLAAKISDDALVTAKQIGKKLMICDAYLEKGLVLICQRNFKGAKKAFAQAYLEKSPNEEDHEKARRLTKIAHLIMVTYDELSQDFVPAHTRLKLCDRLGDLFISINCLKLAIEFYKQAFTEARLCSRPRHEIAKLLYSIGETYADDGQFESALKCFEKELVFRAGNNREQCQSLIKIAQMREYLKRDQEQVVEAYDQAVEKAGAELRLKHLVLKEYMEYLRKQFCMGDEEEFNELKWRQLDTEWRRLKANKTLQEELAREAEAEELEATVLEDEIAEVDDIISDDDDNDEVLMVGRRRATKGAKFKPNEVGDTPLHEACIAGDLRRVKSLIAQGHEINPSDFAGWIPLHEACNHGHYEVAEYLISKGADVNNRGVKGVSPLHDAATNGHFDIMQLLIKHGANVIALTDNGETVLSCLRDFKHRNYAHLSNREHQEYKHMEQELLNLMDRRGYNLLEPQTRPQTSASNPTSEPPQPPPATAAASGERHERRHHHHQQPPPTFAGQAYQASQSAGLAASREQQAPRARDVKPTLSGAQVPGRSVKLEEEEDDDEDVKPRRRRPPDVITLDSDSDSDSRSNSKRARTAKLAKAKEEEDVETKLLSRQPIKAERESVREYRSVMSGLKRRHPDLSAPGTWKRERQEEQPALLLFGPDEEAEGDPSMATKRWIIDDVGTIKRSP